jgi:hypothetical protein
MAGRKARPRVAARYRTGSPDGIGFAKGNGAFLTAGHPNDAIAFATWRGKPLPFVVDYMDRATWADIEDPSWYFQQWRTINMPLVFAVAMIPDDTSTSITTGAGGSYDSHFTALANCLVANGYANATLRVGWEMNDASTFRWTAYNNTANWITFYRRIVTAMRAVTGANFRFDWTMNLGASTVAADLCYPGDAYVDFIGVDAYDADYGVVESNAARWNYVKTQSYGLDWVATFAATHSKPITVPEWGTYPVSPSYQNGGGGGDNPLYINNMFDWFAANNVYYNSYFNFTGSPHDLVNFPNDAAAYKARI